VNFWRQVLTSAGRLHTSASKIDEKDSNKMLKIYIIVHTGKIYVQIAECWTTMTHRELCIDPICIISPEAIQMAPNLQQIWPTSNQLQRVIQAEYSKKVNDRAQHAYSKAICTSNIK